MNSTGDPSIPGETADDTIVADGALPAAPWQQGVALPRKIPSSPTATVGRVSGVQPEDQELAESSTAAATRGDNRRHNTAHSSFEIMGCVSALPAAGGAPAVGTMPAIGRIAYITVPAAPCTVNQAPEGATSSDVGTGVAAAIAAEPGVQPAEALGDTGRGRHRTIRSLRLWHHTASARWAS